VDKELQIIYNKIKNKENFAFVRFGDGEHNIIKNVSCNRKGFKFDKTRDSVFRQELIESLKFEDENYYKGLDCSGKNIFSPRVFVNQNYLDFLKNFNPLFEGCTFVGNIKGRKENLPFKPYSYMAIKNNVWKDIDAQLIEIALAYWLHDKKQHIVLVAGGVWANVFIYNLYLRNPNNIYIDVGSTYDPFLFDKYTRQYHERLDNVS